MRLVTTEEYERFLASHDSVTIESTRIGLIKNWAINDVGPKDFVPEEWTIWSFPQRGSWATHRGNYRGNWSPFVPRNLISRFTKFGDSVCDPMVGGGTTLVECRLMGRNAIGVDVNPDATMVTMNMLDFDYPIDQRPKPRIEVYVGDARSLDAIEDSSIDLVATHPPYADIIPYSNVKVPGDLSALNLDEFLVQMGKVAAECFRILKADRYCGILIGDTRRHLHYIPISIAVLGKFLEAGFVLREDIIKLQHKTMSAREGWSSHRYDFYKIAHEHLYIFRKPAKEEETGSLKYSKKWW